MRSQLDRRRSLALIAALAVAVIGAEALRTPEEPLERRLSVSGVSTVRDADPRANRTAPARVVKPQKDAAAPIPAVRPAPAAKPAPITGDVAKVIGANWPSSRSLPEALRVAKCESGGFTTAVVYGPRTGSAGERGAFQIHPGHFDGRWGEVWLPAAAGVTWDEMFDPAANTRAAYKLFKRSGWGPWTCARRLGIA